MLPEVFSMKLIWVVMLVLAASIGASAQDCKSAIEGVRSAWLAAWNAGKVDDVIKLYAEDATLLTADGHLYVGRAKISDYFKTLIGSVKDVSVKSAGIVCSSDTAYDTGTYKQTVSKGGGVVIKGNAAIKGNATLGGGGPVTDRGNYAVALLQESGEWHVVQHANVRSK